MAQYGVDLERLRDEDAAMSTLARKYTESHHERYLVAKRDHRGCERIVRKVSSFRDGEAARAWAKEQPWYGRIVDANRDGRYWCWWVRR